MKHKRIICMLLILFSTIILLGCEKIARKVLEIEEGDELKICLILDSDNLYDKGMNQTAYEAIQDYAKPAKIPFEVYPLQALYTTNEQRIEVMQKAINDGYEAIFVIGYQNFYAIDALANSNPDVKFIHIDGFKMNYDNVTSITFDKEEMGYLGGYSIVKEGYENIGGIFGAGGGQFEVNALNYGFLKGMNDAAKELNKTVNFKETHQYANDYLPKQELEDMATSWYNDGIDVIFSCGGDIICSIVTAADNLQNKKVIGVDYDCSFYSDVVITSTGANYENAFKYCVDIIKKGKFDEIAKNVITLHASEDAVNLFPKPNKTWRFKNFTYGEYKTLLNKINKQTINLRNDSLKWQEFYGSEKMAQLNEEFTNVNITYI